MDCNRNTPSGRPLAARRLLDLSLLLLLTWTGPGAGTAGATPAVAPPPGASSAFSLALPPSAPMPPPSREPMRQTEVGYYVERYGVDEAEARRRLDLQRRVRDLDQKLIGSLGRGFAQVWFDNDKGHFVVAVSPTGSEGVAARVMADLGLEGSRIERRPFNHEQLAASLAALTERLQEETRAGQVAVGMTAGGLEVRVAAGASTRARSEVSAAVKQSAVAPVVTYRPELSLTQSPAAACTFPYCDTLMAGIRTWSGVGCTAAFYVGSPVDGRPFMLTAGHCVSGGRGWYTCLPGGGACYWAGTEVGGYYGGGGGDGGVLRVDYSTPYYQYWSIYPGWVNWWNTGISTVRASSTTVVGSVVCQNGATTGSACGTVGSTSTAVHYSDGKYLTGMVRVDGTCINGGDSGGPWTMADREWAVGITSGGTLGCNATAYFEPIGRALSTLNVFLYGYP